MAPTFEISPSNPPRASKVRSEPPLPLESSESGEGYQKVERALDNQAQKLKKRLRVKELYEKDFSNFMRGVSEDLEKKRLFICCDGTRNNASGTVDPLTNVVKLARAVFRIGKDKYVIPKPENAEREGQKSRMGNVRQIVYYSSGVGTRSALRTDNLYASAVGKG